jgi:hypothetical protein
MLPLYCPILLVRVGTRDSMGYAYVREEGTQLLIFSSPICLHGNNLPIQKSLYMLLEDRESSKDLRFML